MKNYNGKYALAKHETLALKCEDLEQQLRTVNELQHNLNLQVSKICLLIQMGKTPDQNDWQELLTLERAFRNNFQ